jgi:hypothetical protein
MLVTTDPPGVAWKASDASEDARAIVIPPDGAGVSRVMMIAPDSVETAPVFDP